MFRNITEYRRLLTERSDNSSTKYFNFFDYYRSTSRNDVSWIRSLMLVVRGDEFLEGVEFLSGPAADVGRLTVALKPFFPALSVIRLPETRS